MRRARFAICFETLCHLGIAKTVSNLKCDALNKMFFWRIQKG